MVYTRSILLIILYLFSSWYLLAADLTDIQIINSNKQARVTLNFSGQPNYNFFSLRNPDRIILDIHQSGVIQRLPLNFSGNNLIKCIRSGHSKDPQNIRLVFELIHPAKTYASVQRNGNVHNVIFTVISRKSNAISTFLSAEIGRRMQSQSTEKVSAHNSSGSKKITTLVNNSGIVPNQFHSRSNHTVIVAIDAGHGGQDPGAIGMNALKEKNVTIAIAYKLKAMLDDDPMFKGVLTRDGDYFISVMGRSEMARKKNANLLVSIHADAAPNRSAHGASVWVLSTKRANNEMANWLEQHEKQSELLGGAGYLLANKKVDPYLSKAVLDLQFGHSQHVSYGVAVKVIQQLKQVSALHKQQPEYSSLGVLRSPDIPSLLVETGFISNPLEEQLLSGLAYQEKIARSIYRGLRSYFLMYPLQSTTH